MPLIRDHDDLARYLKESVESTDRYLFLACDTPSKDYLCRLCIELLREGVSLPDYLLATFPVLDPRTNCEVQLGVLVGPKDSPVLRSFAQRLDVHVMPGGTGRPVDRHVILLGEGPAALLAQCAYTAIVDGTTYWLDGAPYN